MKVPGKPQHLDTQALFEKLFASSPDAIVVVDQEGRIVEANPQVESIFGYDCSELLGNLIEILIPERFRSVYEKHRHDYSNQLRTRPMGTDQELCGRRKDGSEFPVDIMLSPVETTEGRLVLGVIRDITQRKHLEEEMRNKRALLEGEMSHLARHDVLTGLPNRLLLNDRLTQAISLARRNHSQLAVLFLDLDGFKHINDSLGHSVGDQLLQSVAERLSACVRKSDTVSRQGGDEFVILLSEVAHAADAAIIAAKINAELKKGQRISNHRLRISASIGLSTYPNDGESAETLIKNADTAMYDAKQSGRNKYRFYKSQMSLQAVERQSTEQQLRYALECEELLVHYQPKVNLKTGVITGVEALLRWQHPERGLLLPRQFMAVAEDTGMIIAIGQWVLREACSQMREWLDEGLPVVPIAINISAQEFRSRQFVQGVQDALKNANLDPKYLELELTESGIMQHAEPIAHRLGQLKAIGVRLAIDDFGTGYASLSYLTRFPIDTLKLDQSFLNDIIVDSDRDIIVDAVVSLGRRLKKKVLAEGVETLEQLRFIQDLGCDEGQGYYFSPPVDAQQFTRLIKEGLLIPLL
ncbi:MAG TPA: EAL domain-containing protein [Verrucomicrobiae bacterium]|jgi:diguanylate cyclase (GGDEF)-like protein/PAS domain S-box-containing protein|nr:EAL domain-containing protein [Verrucomicrobiae bacterium]